MNVFDPLLALQTLVAHRVRFLVIGGFAGEVEILSALAEEREKF